MQTEEKKDIMAFEPTLPENFNGVFYFTNWTDEEFVGVWNKEEHHFAPNSTAPMVMHNFSPLEIQHIRKKFAKDLAEREFFKSQNYNAFKKQETNNDGSARLNSIHQAGTYALKELTPFIQRCLEPLQISTAVVTKANVENLEEKLSLSEKGKPNSKAVGDEDDLENLAKGK